MHAPPADPSNKALSLVSSGSEIAGAAVGAALGFIAAGPVAAAAGGALGTVLHRTIVYTADRVLSQMERARAGAVSAYVLARVSSRLEWGHRPREDLFAIGDKRRSDGEELFEGVLIKARDEYEERKLQHLALFYANLIFDGSVSATTAHRLVKTISQLTYRQLVYLSLVAEEKMVDVGGLRSHERHADADIEAFKLEEMDLLSGHIGLYGLLWNYKDFDDRLSNLGKLVVRLAELDSIPDGERKALKGLLARCPEKAAPKFGYDEPPD